MANQESSIRAAIQRSKQFLETKLKPDLEEATSSLSHLEKSYNDYMTLQQYVITLQENKDEGENILMAHLGQGIHILTKIKSDALIIVSSGLRSSLQDWQTDAGLYLQLTDRETSAFTKRKMVILNKRIKLAKERVALIQSHAELTTKSIEQLEQLLIDPQGNFLSSLKA